MAFTEKDFRKIICDSVELTKKRRWLHFFHKWTPWVEMNVGRLPYTVQWFPIFNGPKEEKSIKVWQRGRMCTICGHIEIKYFDMFNKVVTKDSLD